MNSKQPNPSAPHQVIFVPGFYGTQLNNVKGDELWINASQALWGSDTLAWNHPDLKIKGSQEIKAGQVKQYVKILGGLINKNVYGDTIRALQETLGEEFNVHPLGYDWRQENHKTAKKIAELVKELKAKNPKSISIVAHSMGGLSTAYYLRYGSQDPTEAVETWEGAKQLDRVVISSTPFHGTLIVFHNMLHGVRFGLNKTLMKPETFSSIHSTYEMLPRYETPSTNEKLLMDVNQWEKHNWGLLSQPTPQRKAYTEQRLKRSGQFIEKLHMETAEEHSVRLPLLMAYSHGKDTVDEFQWKKKKLKWGFKDGDSTVTSRSAQLPKAFAKAFKNIQVLKSEYGHQDTLTDPSILEPVKIHLHQLLDR
tara:strand:+ start:11548 stop:12645 length:1098 start_codon:yes stop_codon:yes gene_type:complete